MNKENRPPTADAHKATAPAHKPFHHVADTNNIPPTPLRPVTSINTQATGQTRSASNKASSSTKPFGLNLTTVQQSQPFSPHLTHASLNQPQHQLPQQQYSLQPIDLHAQFRDFMKEMQIKFNQTVQEAEELEHARLVPLMNEREVLTQQIIHIQAEIGALQSIYDQARSWVSQNGPIQPPASNGGPPNNFQQQYQQHQHHSVHQPHLQLEQRAFCPPSQQRANGLSDVDDAKNLAPARSNRNSGVRGEAAPPHNDSQDKVSPQSKQKACDPGPAQPIDLTETTGSKPTQQVKPTADSKSAAAAPGVKPNDSKSKPQHDEK